MTPKPANVLDWFARNPRVGFLGTIASVIGVPLAIFLFLASEKHRDVRYAVSASPTTIVKAGQSSDLRVHFKDKELTSDVSSIQIAIWNAGKESVRRENILSQTLSLKLKPATSILEARVKKMTRVLVAFHIDATDSSSGILTLSWNILEQGDGALLELIYTGNLEEVAIDGAIEGKVPIRRVMFNAAAEPALIWPLIAIISTLLGFLGIVTLYRKHSAMGGAAATVSSVAEGMLGTLLAMGVAFGAVWLYLMITHPSIPFSF